MAIYWTVLDSGLFHARFCLKYLIVFAMYIKEIYLRSIFESRCMLKGFSS